MQIKYSTKSFHKGTLSLEDIQESVAREYGFNDWLTVQQLDDKELDEPFELAVDTVISGKLAKLKNLINDRPEVVTQQSEYGHSATLLHYLGANGVESHRQITPMNAPDIAQCLIEHRANVNACANMYGGGATTLGLVLSSAHPAKAGIAQELASVLKRAGAS